MAATAGQAIKRNFSEAVEVSKMDGQEGAAGNHEVGENKRRRLDEN